MKMVKEAILLVTNRKFCRLTVKLKTVICGATSVRLASPAGATPTGSYDAAPEKHTTESIRGCEECVQLVDGDRHHRAVMFPQNHLAIIIIIDAMPLMARHRVDVDAGVLAGADQEPTARV